jgi:hypothetical protein
MNLQMKSWLKLSTIVVSNPYFEEAAKNGPPLFRMMAALVLLRLSLSPLLLLKTSFSPPTAHIF